MLVKVKQYIQILIFIFCFCSGFWLFTEDFDIAVNYYNQARRFMAANDWGQAEKFLQGALEFYPEFSDAYHLLAGIFVQDNSRLNEARLSWEQAIKLDNWQYDNGMGARKELAALYFRFKAYPEAEKILVELRNNNQADAGTEVLLSKVLQAQHKLSLQKVCLTGALKRFPGESELYILLAGYTYPQEGSAAALKIIENAMRLFPEQPELLLYNAKYTDDPAAKEELLGLYVSRGGRNPEAAVMALEAGFDARQGESYLNFFMANGGNRDLVLLRELITLLAAQPELLEYFRNLEKESGEQSILRSLDSNRDGFAEQQYFYQAGSIGQIFIDNDQDGVNEIEIRFKNEVPVAARRLYNRTFIEYTYGTYPYLESIKYPAARLVHEYLLVPFAVAMPLVPVMETYRYKIDQSLRPPEEQEAYLFSYRINTFRVQTNLLLKSKDLQEGEVKREKIDTDEDGVFDSFVEYQKGLPFQAFRDFDNDGVVDAEESYVQGKLQSIRFDENHDGQADAIQSFPGTGTVLTLWDYNYDGIFDARQQQTGDTVVYDFKTGSGSDFDLTVRFQGSKITGITRGDKALPITREPGRDLYWIGSRGRALAGIEQLPAGRHSSGQQQYFIFHVHGNTYIEEIK